MIEVIGLQKSFRGKPAIRNVSFRANDGAITGLLGTNGAGKSTTLRIIAGLLRADRGEVQIDGTLGALLDHTGLYSRLTAQENLAYFGELRGLSHCEAKDRAAEVLGSLRMDALAKQRVDRFSLGERAKVALGRAILHSPQNLLLDEPTNGLDVVTIRALRALLRSMRDAGCCIVFSSHVLDEVEQLCDEIVILAGGVVIASGSPERIRNQATSASLEDAFVELTEVPGGRA